MKNYLDPETQGIHDEMRKYFFPDNDLILIEYVENVKTAGGVFLAKSEKSMCHPIVAVGDNLKDKYKNGEFLMFKNVNIDVFECFGRKFSVIETYKVGAKVIPTYIIENQKFIEIQDKKKMEMLEASKKSTLIDPNNIN